MKSEAVTTAAPIDPEKNVGEELQRILQEDLALSITACHQHATWETRRRAEAIRLVRKALKRIRATSDLLRTGSHAQEIDEIRARARDLGRKLSPLRDRDVINKTIDQLERTISGKKRKRNVHVMRSILSASHSAEPMGHRSEEQAMAEVAAEARSLQNDIRALDLSDVSRREVLGRAARSWRRARMRFRSRRLFKESQGDFLHETRKRVISLHLQLSALQLIDPKPISKTINRLQRVAEALGTDHDLLVVFKALASERDHFHELTQVLHLEAEMTKKRGRMQKRAFSLGSSALEASSRALRERLLKRWR